MSKNPRIFRFICQNIVYCTVCGLVVESAPTRQRQLTETEHLKVAPSCGIHENYQNCRQQRGKKYYCTVHVVQHKCPTCPINFLVNAQRANYILSNQIKKYFYVIISILIFFYSLLKRNPSMHFILNKSLAPVCKQDQQQKRKKRN